MRFLEWLSLVCDASLLVLATMLVFVPESRSGVLVRSLHVLVVLTFTGVVYRLFVAKALLMPITMIHKSSRVPRPTMLQFAASIMAAIAITITTGFD